MPPDPVCCVSVEVEVVVVVVGSVLEVVVEVVGWVVVGTDVVGDVVVVGSVVAGTVVVSSLPPPPASAITAITRPITRAATRPIATFCPPLIPPSSS